MGKYVITDLTKMRDNKVCTAMVEMESGTCYRPLKHLTRQYLTTDDVDKNNIQIGTIVETDFTLTQYMPKPHIEDSEYKNIQFGRKLSHNEFKNILHKTLSQSLKAGFGATPERNRFFPT